MFVYSILINYILFMSLKIALTSSVLKKTIYIFQMLRGTIVIPFLFFFELSNIIKNYFCLYLLLWISLFICSIIYTSFIKPKEKFYEGINIKKEEYFTIMFSLRKTLVALSIYFMIALLFKYDNFIPFKILNKVKFILFNPILEGISLGIFASCMFLIMQQINTFKNNFLVYQKLMYSLKNIFRIINNLNITEYLLISEMSNIDIKKCDFYKSKFLKEELEYLDNFKNFYLNSLDQEKVNSIIENLNSENNSDNVDASEKILSLLESMRYQKKYPIKYIIDNY